MPKMSRRTVPPADHPWDVWQARLDPLMCVYEISPLYLPALAGGLPPFGLDFNGVLKEPKNAADDRAVRQYYLDTFERILEVVAEFGVRHREHPKFELGGRVERGPELLTGELLKPDRLITECRVYFHLLLAQ